MESAEIVFGDNKGTLSQAEIQDSLFGHEFQIIKETKFDSAIKNIQVYKNLNKNKMFKKNIIYFLENKLTAVLT